MGRIEFRRASSAEPVVSYLSELINRKLGAGERVLWLLSGGSAVELEAAAAARLDPGGFQNLTVTLADERHGVAGHSESIWQQLKDAGFTAPGAKLIPVLGGRNPEDTAREWEEVLKKEFAGADYKLAVLGIGPDGHTAGILPRSPAAAEREKLVLAYEGDAIPGSRPAFIRLTLTPKAFAMLDEAVVAAFGNSKKPALETLRGDLPTEVQPAQILKQLPKVTIFNDQIEGEI